ncbi:FAD dependent oxidoreductase [Sphaerochaeta pleomorpha str. Grapes]|uniref:FAD dependent oxidoreductase n=1 Tax=Sphaerochaeta pleomorpha (strain ATCC BAA-1885 / DSM 22778 / Grapes) TaxID=158190 RepID=G8QTE6_SPHPG|nr:FAD-dependent oxidoreductase [Sphaerochaeta pleomorpha]AEV30187.1 FAD dependent oxidoreductase [Sphaerochaeta pleomorpha str. Grapes]
MDTYISESLETVQKSYHDVVIVGAGVSGIAAAVAARRQGLSVLLVEKSITFGGLATAGLIGWYEPLCDGKGNRLSSSLSRDLFELAISHSYSCLPKEWEGFPVQVDTSRRCATFFSPSIFSMELDDYLQKEGVEVLLDTLFVRPIISDGTVSAIIVEGKSGRSALAARVFVDCSGDADLMDRSGVPCELGRNWLTYIAYLSDLSNAQKAIENKSMLYARSWRNSGADLLGNNHPKDFPKYSGTTEEEVTAFVRNGRQNLFNEIKDMQANKRDIVSTPSMAQFRTTRRIIGARTLTESDEGTFQPDSIAACADFMHVGKRYEVPYGTLYNRDFGNLLCAGRIISSTGWGWEVTRVIPVAVATGQAAGTAASLAVRKDCRVSEVPIAALQANLENQGVHLHI